MPVAVPRRPESEIQLLPGPRLEEAEGTEDFDDEYDEEEDDEFGMDYEMDDEDDFSDDSDDLEIHDSNGSHRTSTSRLDPFDEHFSYASGNYGRGDCRHPANYHRRCRHCVPKFSMLLFSACEQMHRTIFGASLSGFKRANVLYKPLDPAVIDKFKAISAMHDPVYIKRLFNEVVHYICFLHNRNFVDLKAEGASRTKMHSIFELVDNIHDRLQCKGLIEDFRLISYLRDKLRAIGVSGQWDENELAPKNTLISECYR